MRTDLPASEMSYKLAENIKGLEPIIASKIVQHDILRQVKLHKRPKNWKGFVKLIAKIQIALKIVLLIFFILVSRWFFK